jgi:tRNA-modifying protein YgfZ
MEPMTDGVRLDRVVFAVRGEDWSSFLQNLLTADVEALKAAPAVYAGLLTPQGKVIADFILWAAEDGVWVDVNAARAEDLRRRLTMFRLRAKVEIGPIEAGLGVFSGVQAGALVSGSDPRLEALGQRSVAPAPAPAPEAEPDAYRHARITLGAPDLAHDSEADEVFALEALFEEFGGVGFHKGCFVGQENVSRMKRRATTRRKFCPIVHEGPALARGAEITAGAAVLGNVRSATHGRALGLIRLDRALEAQSKGAALTVGNQSIRLDPPPWLRMPAEE